MVGGKSIEVASSPVEGVARCLESMGELEMQENQKTHSQVALLASFSLWFFQYHLSFSPVTIMYPDVSYYFCPIKCKELFSSSIPHFQLWRAREV